MFELIKENKAVIALKFKYRYRYENVITILLNDIDKLGSIYIPITLGIIISDI